MKPPRLLMAQLLCRYLPPIVSQRIRDILYPYSLACSDDYPFVAKSHTGSRFAHRTSDSACYVFSVHGYFVWRNWAIARAVVRPGDTLVEVGANVGTETIGYLDMVGPQGKVIAVEPNPACIQIIEKQISLNGFANLHLLGTALGSAHGFAEFVVPPINQSQVGFIGAARLDQQSIDVECRTLDSITAQLDKCAMIVIDVEGAEMEVLTGGRDCISRLRPVILIEAKQKHLKKRDENVNSLYGEISRYDYRVFGLGKLSLHEVTYPVNEKYDGDWLCIPSEKSPSLRRDASRSLQFSGLFPLIRGLNPIKIK